MPIAGYYALVSGVGQSEAKAKGRAKGDGEHQGAANNTWAL
jgi:hypothetical protein